MSRRVSPLRLKVGVDESWLETPRSPFPGSQPSLPSGPDSCHCGEEKQPAGGLQRQAGEIGAEPLFWV